MCFKLREALLLYVTTGKAYSYAYSFIVGLDALEIAKIYLLSTFYFNKSHSEPVNENCGVNI